MSTISITKARQTLYSLVDEVARSRRPMQIVGKRNSAILIAEEDWKAIQETLYLTAIPGMRESVCEGLNTPVDQCHKELEW